MSAPHEPCSSCEELACNVQELQTLIDAAPTTELLRSAQRSVHCSCFAVTKESGKHSGLCQDLQAAATKWEEANKEKS